MKWTRSGDRSGAPKGPSGQERWRRGYAAILMAGAVLSGAAWSGAFWAGAQQTPPSGQQQATSSPPAHGQGPGPASNASPQPVSSLKSETGNSDAANTDRKKQIADEGANLLKLATDLKAEVDKTTKDTLSLNVIRKADQIEKLAHDVKEQMKVTVVPN
jgi:hypothetical protein